VSLLNTAPPCRSVFRYEVRFLLPGMHRPGVFLRLRSSRTLVAPNPWIEDIRNCPSLSKGTYLLCLSWSCPPDAPSLLRSFSQYFFVK
jgi:hypothetical protein